MEPTTIYAVSDDGMVKVEWVDLGEGYYGDFDDDDPTDEPLLRFDAYVRWTGTDADERRSLEWIWDDPEWGIKSDGSYCTNVPTVTDDETLEMLAGVIANRLAESLDNGGWKRTAESMSWATPAWLDTVDA